MPRTRGARFSASGVVRATADAVAALLGVGGAWFLLNVYQTGRADLETSLLLGSGSAAIVVGSLAWKGLYLSRNTVLNLLEFRSVLVGAAIAGGVFLAAVLVTGLFDGDPQILALATFALAPALLVERRILASLRASRRWMNGDSQRTLVYGYNEAARLLMKKIVQAPEAGRELIGFVDDFMADGTKVHFRVDRSGSPPFSAPLVGRTENLADLVREHRITEVLVSSPDFELSALSRIGDAGQGAQVRWGIAAQFGDVRPDELVVEDLGAIPVLWPEVPSPHWAYLLAKRVFDVLIAGLGLLLSAPLWLVIAAAIRLESGSPIFFHQERVGEGGTRFTLLKFRSLRNDTNPYQSSKNIGGSQVTRVGRILRVTALDELPQLINVLRGDMSLVGPRPEMPFLVESYSEVQARRLTAQPGITGVWQLSADRQGMEIHENMEFDLFYIAHRSFLLDLVILFETVVFTTSALFRAGRSRIHPIVEAPSGRRPDPPSLESREYVLVALDQRGAVDLWTGSIRAAESLLDGSLPVRVLGNEERIHELRAIWADVVSGQDLSQKIQFVPYRNRSTLRALMANARLVITDLKEFDEIAESLGTESWQLPTRRPVRLESWSSYRSERRFVRPPQ